MDVKTLKKMLETVDEDLIVCFFDEDTELPVEIDSVTAPANESYITVGNEVTEGRVMLLGS